MSSALIRTSAGAVAALAAGLSAAAAVRAARHVPARAFHSTGPEGGGEVVILPGRGGPPRLEPDPAARRTYAEHLAALIRHPTIAQPDHAGTDPAPFHALQATMRDLFPALHDRLELERIGPHGTGLLFRWPGSDADLATEPLVLMAHQDVVPTEGQAWDVDPFAGVVTDGRVTGRGAIDDKGALLTILEAVEGLLARNFIPRRDVYLALGDCEETAGPTAAEMARLLRERSIRPWMVLDEGGAVVDGGVLPGVATPAAMIGVAERGILDVRLTTRDAGGHASTPPRNGATTRLARALVAIEKRRFPARLPEPALEMLATLGRHAPFGARLLYANVDVLARPLAVALTRLGPETAAMARTTVAATRLTGSPAANVLATEATAALNIRLAVGTTSADAVAHLRRAIADESVAVEVVDVTEPSPVSPTDDDRWGALEHLVAQVFPDAVAAPYVQNGATDSRRFATWCEHVYRFAPLRMSDADRARLHAANESVSVVTLAEGVDFMTRLIEEVAG
ncbi:MAG: M20/M25/M40 family metallo-hydrolase [Actinobacteria bacterium]|nr:M20/M25/M40 family metallo-hydrolase [Actinomycetota bacterium]